MSELSVGELLELERHGRRWHRYGVTYTLPSGNPGAMVARTYRGTRRWISTIHRIRDVRFWKRKEDGDWRAY